MKDMIIYGEKLEFNTMYQIDNYVVINLKDEKNIMTNGEKIYNLGNYESIDKVLEMNGKLYIVAKCNLKKKLVSLVDLVVVLDEYGIDDITKVDEDKIKVMSHFHFPNLYSISEKRYIQNKDNLKYSYKLGNNLFVYEMEDLADRYYFVYDGNGELIFKCNDEIPYYINGNLVLLNLKKEEINIVHNLLTGRGYYSTISKQNPIIAAPQIYNNYIVYITRKGITLIDADLKCIKNIVYPICGEVINIHISENFLLIENRKEDKNRKILVNLNNDFYLECDNVEILSYGLNKKKIILGFNYVDKKEKKYYLYDELGNLLIEQLAMEANIIASQENNTLIFKNVNQTNRHTIFNIDSKIVKEIPWNNINYQINCDGNYGNFALCYNKDTNLFDIIDKHLEVLIKNIDLKKINLNNFLEQLIFFIIDDYAYLIEPLSAEAYRYIILNSEGKIHYDVIGTNISKIGMPIIYQNKSPDKLTNNFDLPDNIIVDNGTVKLLKKEVSKEELKKD